MLWEGEGLFFYVGVNRLCVKDCRSVTTQSKEECTRDLTFLIFKKAYLLLCVQPKSTATPCDTNGAVAFLWVASTKKKIMSTFLIWNFIFQTVSLKYHTFLE